MNRLARTRTGTTTHIAWVGPWYSGIKETTYCGKRADVLKDAATMWTPNLCKRCAASAGIETIASRRARAAGRDQRKAER